MECRQKTMKCRQNEVKRQRNCEKSSINRRKVDKMTANNDVFLYSAFSNRCSCVLRLTFCVHVFDVQQSTFMCSTFNIRRSCVRRLPPSSSWPPTCPRIRPVPAPLPIRIPEKSSIQNKLNNFSLYQLSL